MEDIRLNKYLADAGICSRREADKLILAGSITVDGKVATMGMKVSQASDILYKGKKVIKESKYVLIALNKPVGIECTTDKRNKDNIVDFINFSTRIFPIGRLDKNSEGLILLTNYGELSDKMMRGSNYHEKEYVVTVDREIDKEFIKSMSGGIPIVDKEHGLDTVTRRCFVEKISKDSFRIILTQGLNRQIRRMCKYLGYNVIKLKRIRIMNIKLDGIKSGKYRIIEDKEYSELLRLLSKKK
ncbi:MAG: pseudouridine synthase [Clostridiales bacterium]|nr:pseudouridine synthase [Clostridiales bacterium]